MRMMDFMKKKPEEPEERDCCHNGCNSCVFDIYQKQLRQWELKKLNNDITSQIRWDMLSQTRFKPFRVIQILNVTPDTNQYMFQPLVKCDKTVPLCSNIISCSYNSVVSNVNSNSSDSIKIIPGILPYKAGQHLIMRGYLNAPSSLYKFSNHTPLDDIEDDTTQGETLNLGFNNVVSRAYTLVYEPNTSKNCCFKVIIKLYQIGEMTSYIRGLTVGDVVEWRGPYGDFKYITNSSSYLLMLCIGTGIAPLYATAKSIVDNENEETKINLLYGCRTESDIILRSEINDLLMYWNFKCKYYLSHKSNAVPKRFGEVIVNERINSESVMMETIGKVEKLCVLICGNRKFNDDMLKNVLECGICINKVHIF